MDFENFDPRYLLPENIVIKSAGTHFYRIGLSLFPNGSKKRSKIHNPLFIFVIQLLVTIRYIIGLLTSNENRTFLLLSGNVFHFLNMRIHGNIAATFVNSIVIISELYHYKNYKNGIKPSYLKPFEMMSGLVSPQSIGLTNKQIIYEFMKRTRVLLNFCQILTDKALPFFSFTLIISIYSVNCSLLEIIIIGIPHSILWALVANITIGIIFWQVMYFYIICYYVRSKIKVINSKLETKVKNKFQIKNFHLIQTIKSLSSVYSEIIDYNNNYWSKFLFWIWILLTTLIDTFLYLLFFGDLQLFQRMLFYCFGFQFISTLLIIIIISSSVNFEAKKSYKILYSLIAYTSSRNFRFDRNRIKV